MMNVQADINLLRNNINTINKTTEATLKARMGVGLEVNTEEINYMLVSRRQIAGKVITRHN
jgi:hypothetical protein